jgi:addiction module HigA family antidote
MAFTNELPTIGEVLSAEFLEPMNITQNGLAKALGIPQNRLSDIINGKRGVSADTDLRLCKYFGLTDGYFSGMQADFDRITAKRKILADLKKLFPCKIIKKRARGTILKSVLREKEDYQRLILLKNFIYEFIFFFWIFNNSFDCNSK